MPIYKGNPLIRRQHTDPVKHHFADPISFNTDWNLIFGQAGEGDGTGGGEGGGDGTGTGDGTGPGDVIGDGGGAGGDGSVDIPGPGIGSGGIRPDTSAPEDWQGPVGIYGEPLPTPDWQGSWEDLMGIYGAFPDIFGGHTPDATGQGSDVIIDPNAPPRPEITDWEDPEQLDAWYDWYDKYASPNPESGVSGDGSAGPPGSGSTGGSTGSGGEAGQSGGGGGGTSQGDTQWAIVEGENGAMQLIGPDDEIYAQWGTNSAQDYVSPAFVNAGGDWDASQSALNFIQGYAAGTFSNNDSGYTEGEGPLGYPDGDPGSPNNIVRGEQSGLPSGDPNSPEADTEIFGLGDWVESVPMVGGILGNIEAGYDALFGEQSPESVGRWFSAAANIIPGGFWVAPLIDYLTAGDPYSGAEDWNHFINKTQPLWNATREGGTQIHKVTGEEVGPSQFGTGAGIPFMPEGFNMAQDYPDLLNLYNQVAYNSDRFGLVEDPFKSPVGYGGSGQWLGAGDSASRFGAYDSLSDFANFLVGNDPGNIDYAHAGYDDFDAYKSAFDERFGYTSNVAIPTEFLNQPMNRAFNDIWPGLDEYRAQNDPYQNGMLSQDQIDEIANEYAMGNVSWTYN